LIKGLGAMTDAIINSEIIDWGRFRNRAQCQQLHRPLPKRGEFEQPPPSGFHQPAWQPASAPPTGGSGLAHGAMAPQYPPLKILHEARGSRARRRAAVAVARRLAVDLWRIRTGQSTAEQLGLKLLPLTVGPFARWDRFVPAALPHKSHYPASNCEAHG
jgi:hypothetical protein